MSDDLESLDSFEPLDDVDLLREMLLPLVTQPKELRIEALDEPENATRLRIHAAPEDRGRVIGKSGTGLDALRAYFRRVGQAEGRKVWVELFEPDRVQRKTVAA